MRNKAVGESTPARSTADGWTAIELQEKGLKAALIPMAKTVLLPKLTIGFVQWWRTPLIPALGSRGRWISEFKASLVYRVSSRITNIERLRHKQTKRTVHRGYKNNSEMCLSYQN